MRYMRMLIVMTVMAFVAAGSARGVPSPGPLLLDRTAVTASGLSSLPAVKSDESLSKAIFPAALKSTVAQLFVAASAQGGKADDKKEKEPHRPPPPPRSKRCPPDPKGDHRDDKCGKGDDSKNSVVSH